MATYGGPFGENDLQWQEVGHLPRASYGLRASVIENTIFVTGGSGQPDSILSWNLNWDGSGYWKPEGTLSVGRHKHAAVAIPLSMIQSGCL